MSNSARWAIAGATVLLFTLACACAPWVVTAVSVLGIIVAIGGLSRHAPWGKSTVRDVSILGISGAFLCLSVFHAVMTSSQYEQQLAIAQLQATETQERLEAERLAALEATTPARVQAARIGLSRALAAVAEEDYRAGLTAVAESSGRVLIASRALS